MSNKGMVRPNNEDSIYSSANRDLFIVADGMGGHKGGEIASKAAVNKIKYYIKNKINSCPKTKDGISDLINSAYNYACRAIYNLSQTDDLLYGMGTTAVTALIVGDTVYIGHVGDSRAYIINNRIKQITKDHSLVQELLDSGSITLDEANNHPNKNIITRALGTGPNVVIDIYSLKIKMGDCILLCSDGLTNMCSDEEILNIVKNKSPNIAAKKLVNEANVRGGFDNVSVIIIKNENNI